MAYAYQSSRGERYPKDKSLPYLVKPGLFFVVVVVVVVVFFFFGYCFVSHKPPLSGLLSYGDNFFLLLSASG